MFDYDVVSHAYLEGTSRFGFSFLAFVIPFSEKGRHRHV
jgi:hypothetical protein